MRIIPKNSKVNIKVFRDFTLFDMLIGLILGCIIFVILLTNFPGKFYIALAFTAFSILLFLENDGIRAYRDFFQIFRFLASKKTFTNSETGRASIDLLMPYSDFAEDGTIMYNGYYGRVISIGCVEFRLLNEWTQNTRISQLASIFNQLQAEQSMQLIKIDRPINFDDISDRLYKKIQDTSQEHEHKLRILRSRLGQIDAINNIEKQIRPYFYLVFFDTSVENLNALVENARNTITYEMKINTEILDLKQTVLFLKYCYSRNFEEREIEEIAPEEYISFVKPDSISFNSSGYELDGVRAVSISVIDYPLEVGNAWGAGLFGIENTKVVLNIKPIDKSKALKQVDRTVTELGTQAESISKASQMMSNSTHLETMGTLLNSLQNENESMLDCSITITGFNHEGKPENAFRKQIEQRIRSGGFKTNSLRGRQLEAFVTGNISSTRRLKMFDRGINSESLAAVFPFVVTSIIEPDGISLGYNTYPVILDFWKRDGNKYTSSNVLILGKPGGGKSFFTKMLLANMYSDNAKIFILDPENEYDVLAERLGGVVIDVGNATSGRLNPFHIYQVLTDDGKPAPPNVVYEAHLRFLESFLRVVLPDLNQDSLEIINNLVVECYAKKHIYPTTDCTRLSARAYPIFDDLLAVINSAAESETNNLLKVNLQRAQNYIAKFAAGGRYSNLWNGASSLTSNEQITVFNFQGLFAAKNSTVANGQMLMVMRYLEQQVINIREHNKNNPNSIIRPVVAFDEAYTFVDPKYPVALDFVYYWEKRIRKYFGSVIFITQNVKDLTSNPETLSRTMAIINNSQYSCIFPLAPADISDLVEIYSGAGEINEVEQHEIANNGQGRAFLISAPDERTTLRIVASDTVKDYFVDKNQART